MKDNFYYYSSKDLKFKNIKNFYARIALIILLSTLVFSCIIFGSYFFITDVISNGASSKELQVRNSILSTQLNDLLVRYKKLDTKINHLYEKNNDLRLSVNLPAEDSSLETVGVGGSLFDNVDPSNTSDEKKMLVTLDNYVDKIEGKINYELENYSEIKNKLKKNEILYASIPAIKPVNANYGDGFGMRMHPILKIRRMHAGVDFLANTETPIYAPGDGKVIYRGRSGGYGLTLKISHGFGYTTLYGHLSKIKVRRGQKVKRGELIAYSGNSGNLSTGPHLHYEVRYKGRALNPRYFIFNNIKIFDYLKLKQKEKPKQFASAID